MDKNNTFTFCPVCGGKEITSTARKWTCPQCGFDLYNNVAASVALIIRDDGGNVLFLERAKEPRKGFLALPGGFVDPDESLEEAAIRECFEETALSIKNPPTGTGLDALKYLCSFPNSYNYRGVHYKTCDTFWIVKLKKRTSIEELITHLSRQEKEVSRFAAYPCRTNAEVNAIPLAFGSALNALHLMVEKEPLPLA